MMKSEFESLAGRNVTDEQYKAIETLYMSSNLEKAEFVKSIRTMLKSIQQPPRQRPDGDRRSDDGKPKDSVRIP